MTVHDLAAGLDRHRQIDAILLDFSKAFDKVPHQRLAAKLHHYGIRDQTLSWIKSVLADSSQQVVFPRREVLFIYLFIQCFERVTQLAYLLFYLAALYNNYIHIYKINQSHCHKIHKNKL